MISAATEEAEATAEDSVTESRTIITAEATETRVEITIEETATAAAGTEEAETEETSVVNRPTTSTTNGISPDTIFYRSYPPLYCGYSSKSILIKYSSTTRHTHSR